MEEPSGSIPGIALPPEHLWECLLCTQGVTPKQNKNKKNKQIENQRAEGSLKSTVVPRIEMISGCELYSQAFVGVLVAFHFLVFALNVLVKGAF